MPPEAPEPTIKKKRKCADARQVEVLNRVYVRTTYPPTEELQQLARTTSEGTGCVFLKCDYLVGACLYLHHMYISENLLFFQVPEQR